MSKRHTDKHTNQTSKTGEVRMGEEVSNKAPTAGDLNAKPKSAANKEKQTQRENAASSLV